MSMVTKESLQQKIDGFKQQHAQATANANAIAGAIQALEQLLQELNQPDTAPEFPAQRTLHAV